MLAVIAVALALAGASPGTSVSCSQTLPAIYSGFTYWSTPPRIELDPKICGGLLLLGATQAERARIAAVNPGIDLNVWMGRAALSTLHEASHASGLHNETDAQCKAMTLVAGFLQRYAASGGLPVAQAWDARLSPVYHAHPC